MTPHSFDPGAPGLDRGPQGLHERQEHVKVTPPPSTQPVGRPDVPVERLRVDYVIKLIIVGLFASAIILGFVQIILRYLFHSALFWAEELIRYMFIWMLFLSTAVAVKRVTHIRIDVINRGPSSLTRFLQIVTRVLIVTFGIGMIVFGGHLSFMNMYVKSPALRVPIGLAYASIPVSGLFIAAYSCRQLVRAMNLQVR